MVIFFIPPLPSAAANTILNTILGTFHNTTITFLCNSDISNGCTHLQFDEQNICGFACLESSTKWVEITWLTLFLWSLQVLSNVLTLKFTLPHICFGHLTPAWIETQTGGNVLVNTGPGVSFSFHCKAYFSVLNIVIELSQIKLSAASFEATLQFVIDFSSCKGIQKWNAEILFHRVTFKDAPGVFVNIWDVKLENSTNWVVVLFILSPFILLSLSLFLNVTQPCFL